MNERDEIIDFIGHSHWS